MSFATVIDMSKIQQLEEPTGARHFYTTLHDVHGTEGIKTWQQLWSQAWMAQSFNVRLQNSAPVVMSVSRTIMSGTRIVSNAAGMLILLEKFFGDSPTNMAKILHVSRPMIYHYRSGMEPSIENRRRIETLATLAGDYDLNAIQPLKGALRSIQPEGRTLLDFLSEDELDVEALRLMLRRTVASSDAMLRERLATELVRGESEEARKDILQARHAEGQSVYVGEPNNPGKLIQIRPDGRRIHGRLVDRKFIPDEE